MPLQQQDHQQQPALTSTSTESYEKLDVGLIASQDFPSKIWQSWKDDSENPTSRTVGFPHKWRTMNPGWRYERVTDSNEDEYVQSRFDEDTAAAFTSLKDNILKADFLRYLIMLKEGGVWADIDVLPRQPVSKWIPDEFKGRVNLVTGIENDHMRQPIWPGSKYSVQLCQYTILAKPNHPALRRLVGDVVGNLAKLLSPPQEVDRDGGGGDGRVSFEEVMATTGPFAFTKALMDYFDEETGMEHTGDELSGLGEPRLIGDVLVLPKDSFGWLPQEHGVERGHESILVEHLFMGSWRERHPG